MQNPSFFWYLSQKSVFFANFEINQALCQVCANPLGTAQAKIFPLLV
jgi:hypothetical protein